MIKLGFEIQAIWGWPLPYVQSGPGLKPSASWDGTAQSGFTTLPTDPSRVTAKPALRLLEPPRQRFTNRLTVGAAAFALDGATLIGGIDRVRFHFEGNSLDVVEPTFRTLTREDGSSYDCLGYWADIAKPGSASGEALLYVEAIPSDASKQSRVIGPYSFFPADTLHDWEATCGAAGDYTNLRSAMQAARAAGANHALIELIDSGDYTQSLNPSAYTPAGYTTVRAAPGATPRITRANGDESEIRLRHARMWFERIEFDLSRIARVRGENPSEFVVKHCRMINPDGRALFLKANRVVSWIFDDNPWFLENYFEGAQECLKLANLARGNDASNVFGDFLGLVYCSANNTCDDLDDEQVAGELAALLVEYSGSGTAEVSGTDSGSGASEVRTFDFLVNGVSVGTFAAWRQYTHANDGDNRYEVQDLADFINALAGWSATVLDNDRQAASLTLGGQGGFGANDFAAQAVGAGLTLASDFALHQDAITSYLGAHQNIIHYANRITKAEGQLLFLGGDGGNSIDYQDLFVINCLFEMSNATAAITSRLQTIAEGAGHIGIVHNTWIDQSPVMNFTATINECLIANNVARMFTGNVSTVTVTNNHVQSDGGTLGTGYTNTVRAGTRATLYANADLGDFTPAGELLANPKLPVAPFDLGGALREGLVAVGART